MWFSLWKPHSLQKYCVSVPLYCDVRVMFIYNNIKQYYHTSSTFQLLTLLFPLLVTVTLLQPRRT
jgi:hypothetical protein